MERKVLNPHSYILYPKEVDSKSKKIGRAYCRCSTDKQVKDNGSVEVQLEIVTRYANNNNIMLVAIYFDEAVSGTKKTNERLALDTVRKDLKKDETLICTAASRLGRNLASTFTLTEELEKRGVNVHLTDIGDITGSQRLVFNMMMVMAANEQKQISERVSAAMQHIKAKGELKTRPKFGERWTGIKRTYETDTEAMEIIEYLRELRLTEPEISYREMARRLNEEFNPSMFKKKTWRGPDIKRYSIAWNIPLKAGT